MKNIITLILILFFSNSLFAQTQTDTLLDCAKAANKKGKMVYLKSFQTNLNAEKNSEKWPLMLNSGTKYRFYLCENGQGKAENIELVLLDKAHPESSPYMVTKKKTYFYFECNKTGTYHLLIRYKKDFPKNPVNAAAVLFYVKKNKQKSGQ